MANRGVGTKYVSVNLNKSYGHQQSNNHQIQSGSPNGYGSNRNRAGGGMVVLSRPRSSQKAGPKLSVPPPLNLPSIRKEHERIDLGSNAHSAGGISGSGTRPASSGLGWSKPAVAVALQDKGRTGGDIGSDVVDGPSKMGNGVYMPPVARSGTLGTPGLGSDRGFPSVEKAAILRGEDFPSLKATLPLVSGPGQKQKERINQKQKQLAGEELSKEQGNTSRFTSSHIDMKPHTQSAPSHVDNGSSESASFHYGFPSPKQGRKQEEDIPGLLPLVHLSPRSDWADDERDTKHGLRDRDRDHRYQKDEVVWERDFDMPRAFSLPHKPAAHNYFDRSGHRESEAVKLSTGEVRPQSGVQEANTWRVSSPLQKEVGNNRNGIGARPSSRGREMIKANVYTSSPLRENARDCSGMRNSFYQHGGKQPWNSSVDFPSNRGILTRDRHSSEQQNRDRRPYSKGENSYIEEDPFGDSGFDVRDPFPVLGVVKKKKEALREADFHDPVRESFEAELERVQKMQEEERRRITDEQERAIEKARREEEERMRLAWEHEERQRILEEEAREAAWRAEQERLEAIRRAEELRKAKEEEKNRIRIEEERRKQAANQKLRELEERMAKRKAEAAKGGSSSSTFSEAKNLGIVEESDVSRPEDAVDWEDGERRDKLTISVPVDTSILNRSFGMNSGLNFPKDGSSKLLDSGKPANSWRKDSLGNPNNSMFISQDIENVSRITQLDDGRVFTKNEFFGAAGYGSSRTYYKAGTSDPPIDELSNLKGQRWRIPGDGDHHGRNNDMESDYQEGFGDRYGDLGWGQRQGISHRVPYDPYPEKLYQNTMGDDYYPFGRTRNSVRQPRVLPPPSLASSQKPFYRTGVDRPGPSTYVDNEMKHNHGGTESTAQGGYGGDYQTGFSQHQVSRKDEQHLDRKLAPGCDSQSSLSVSSPPDSPIHLSHDDLDESGASSVSSGAGKSRDCTLLENHKDPGVSTGDNNVTAAASEDDEEWAIDNNEELQEQEEYDDDEDGYQEEDEIRASYEENLDLTPEFEDMHIQDKDSNMVLGFNEGVEVEMPSDDFEKCHQNGELSFKAPQHPIVSVEGQGSSVIISAKESRTQPVEAPSQPNVDDSSKIFLETENAIQNLAIQSGNALQTSVVPEMSDKVNPLTNSSETTRSGIPPSFQMAPELLSVKPVNPSSSAPPSHLEEPVKLQFGLLSGPSLTPSPVPAVQIGSIPLPLHPQVGSSVTHMQATQPPVFQLGQLRYTSPIYQGVLPLTSHSFARPSASSSVLLNKDPVVHAPVQLAYGDSAINMVTTTLPLSSGPQAGPMRSVDPNWNTLKNVDALPAREGGQAVMQKKQSESAFQQEGLRKTSLIERAEGHSQTGASAPLPVSIDTDMRLSKANSQAYRGRGKRDIFAARNLSSRNFDSSEVSHVDASGYRRTPRQRTELRVRSSNHDASNTSRRIPANSMGNGTRNIAVPNKSAKRSIEPDSSRSSPAISQKMDSGCNFEIRAGKETVVEGQNIPNSGQTNLKRNFFSEEDIDVPLQSGIVRVFEQRGIETPSDDDDFIEVRSKRQMLNDRREQREKEIKAKSRETKATQKPRSTVQNHVAVTRSNKSSAPGGGVNSKQSISIINKQQLAPIGTPTHKANARADSKSQRIKSHETSVLPTVSRSLQNLPSNFIFNNENKVSDSIQSPLESWSGSQIDQPVMALTQSQLDDAMKPASIDSCAPVEDHTSEPKVASTSALAKDETILSIANPIDSLLAAGQIQFGAVTASTVLPPSSRVASHGIGASGLSQVDLQASTDHGGTLLYPKGKHLNDASAQLKEAEAEAEAEAAASAVAVAAITSDENGGNVLVGSSVSAAETKSFVGIAGEQSNQSKVEESLSVSLPADLSVDTPPISLWPPLSSPHNSNQMITHFPPGPPHFPFYDMNPTLRAPIFAFGPRDEAGSNQSQPQMGTGTISAPPPGTWQQCPPGVDSCYRPTGFTGPFISQPGGMSGVQGSPHMVVYNHFAPVGQFGQVGLSFMGTTYIPSGKQPDWKHNPVSSPMIGGDCDANNPTVGSTQRNPTIMSASVQHLAPGSALLPMPMFDVSPFQSSADMPVQARWPHIVPTPLQLAPSSMPLQQQKTEGALSSQFNNMPSIDQLSAANRFPDVRTSTSSDTTRTFSAVKDLPSNRFPDELGLADTSVQRSVVTNIASSSVAETNRTQNRNSGFKPPPSQQKNVTSTGFYNHQRGSQRNNEWHPHHPRRSGFQGRNQPMGGEKSFPAAKVKQIYVAKQTSSSSTSITTTTLPSREQ